MRSPKSTFKKSHLVEIGTIIALLVLASLFKVSVDTLKEADNKINSNLATLAINFDNLNRSFEGEVLEDMTVLDALNMAMAAGKIKLVYVLDENNQTWVMEINDHMNKQGGNYFTFYLNNKQIDSKDLNRVSIRAGDSMVITYE